MTDLPNEHPPEDLPEFQDSSRWLWRALVIVAVLVLLGLLVARPVYHRVKAWRAGRIVAEGYQALEAGDLPATSRAARAALGLAPFDPQVLRLAAQYCVKGNLPDGINYWQLLLKTGAATLADRQEYTRFAQKLERFDLADDLIQDLLVRDAENRDTRLIVLDQHAALGNWRMVIGGLEVMRQKEPGDPYLQFILARAYLNSGAPDLATKAADLLRPLAATNNSQQLPALRTLASMFGPTPAELAAIADQLAAGTNAIADQLLAWDVRIRLAPAQRAETEKKVVASLLPANLSTNDLVAVAEWLRGHRRPELAQQLVPEARALKSPPLLLVHCETLADQRRWAELEAILSDPKSRLMPTARGCLKALHATGTGHAAQAGGFLADAVKAAGTSVEQLEIIARFAEQLGQPEAATEAWTAMLRNPRTTVPAAMMLLRLAKSHDDLSIERLVYQHLLVPLGDQKQVRYQNAYLSLLFNEKSDRAAAELAALNRQYPNDVDIYMALALAELRQGRADKALSLCESANLDWEKQPARWRAVYAVVLDANQQREASRQLARRLNPAQLKVPERQLIKPLLTAQ